MLFCYVLPPSALKQPSRNRAVIPWRLSCGLAGGSFPRCAFPWSTPETSGPYQANSPRQPVHTPVLCQHQSSIEATPREHPPPSVKGPSSSSSSVLLQQGDSAGFPDSPLVPRSRIRVCEVFLFQDQIPLLESLRPEQPDSKLLEEWISSQTAWTPAPAAWQQGGKLLNLAVQRRRQSPGLGFP